MRFRNVLLNALGALVVWTGAGAQTPGNPTPHGVSIRAEPLGDALNDLAQQTGLQILFSSELVAGLHAPEGKGSLTADAALRKILFNSGLRFEFVNPHTVAILGPQPPPKKIAALPNDTNSGGGTPMDDTADTSIQSKETIMRHRSLI